MKKISKIIKWLFGHDLGSLLLGVGTFLIGIAAIHALAQTNNILDKVMQIQKQEKIIHEGVESIKQATDILTKQLIANQTIKIVGSSSLKNSKVTRDQIQKVIDSIPSAPTCNNSIYLPSEQKSEIVNQLQKYNTPEARERILQNTLKYKTPMAVCYPR